MKLFILIAFFMLITPIWALDCKLPDGSVLPDGDANKKSLYNEGAVMADQKTLDQDGVGVCYSVAATTALKYVLPGKKDYSYHHAAIVSTMEGVNGKVKGKQGNYEIKSDEKGKEGQVSSAFEGSFVCETVRAMKKKGGACEASRSRLEQKEFACTDEAMVQARAYHGLGAYFDAINKFKDDKVKMDELKKEITHALEIIDKEPLQKEKVQCEKDYIPAGAGVAKMMDDAALFELVESCAPRRKALEALAGKGSKFPKHKGKNSDMITFIPSVELTHKVEKILQEDPAIADAIRKYANEGTEFPKEMTVKLGDKINALFGSLYPSNLFEKCNGLKIAFSDDDQAHPLLGMNKTATVKDLLTGISTEMASVCKRSNNYDSVKARVDKDCVYAHTELIVDAILPIKELGEKIDNEKILELLINPVAKEAKQLQDILMPNCAGNLTPMDKVTCEDFSMCRYSKHNDPGSNYQGPAKKNCFDMPGAMKAFGKHAMKAIEEKRPLVVNICTEFFSAPKVTKFCQKADTSGKHGLHAFTLTGYRCQNGKIQYEMLNSWGKQHCPENKTDIECIKKDGQPTGRYWINAEALVDNTTGVSAIGKKD